MTDIKKNPFDLAIEARQARGGQRLTVEFMHTVYQEAGLDYDACQVATATYLAWNQSALRSGVTFPEFLIELGFSANCRFDRAIASQFATYLAEKTEQEGIRRQQAADERKNLALLKGAVGIGGVSALSVVGIVLYRRHVRAMEAMLNGERPP